MEDINGQEHDIGMNNDEDNDNNEVDSDNDEEEEEYPLHRIMLNEYTFQRLKQIDPTVTGIEVESTDYMVTNRSSIKLIG